MSNGDKIYPNVSVGGINVGGMTVEQAIRVLDAEGGGVLPGGLISVRFPLGYSLELDVSEAMIAGRVPGLAESALNYGRDSNIVSNLFTYLKSLGSKTDLLDDEFIAVNEPYVRALIDEIARTIASDELNSGMTVTDTEIVLIKGAEHVLIDVNAVYEIVRTALVERNYTALEYMPAMSGNDSVDFMHLFDLIYTVPESSVYVPETGEITEHVTGLSFDIRAAQSLWDNARIGDHVRIPLVITEPELTSTFLRDSLFADVLAQKSTSLYGSSSARINNITLAAASINGIILNPGDEFSYNAALGQRTAASGYQAAGAYSGGRVVSEIGGGICQNSSTLYYTVLHSNLEVVDRTCHYFAIGYLPSGLDATVSWTSPDFKFRNNRDLPIRIEAYTDMTDYTLTVKIHGTDVDGSYVVIETETWGTATGTGALTYRLVYDKNDTLISRAEEARSIYHYQLEETEEEIDNPDGTEEPEDGENPEGTENPEDVENPTETENPDDVENPTETENPPDIENPTETETPGDVETPPEIETPTETETPPDVETPPIIEVPTETETPPAIETPPEIEAPPLSENPPEQQPVYESISESEE